jgi:hypothetical protein
MRWLLALVVACGAERAAPPAPAPASAPAPPPAGSSDVGCTVLPQPAKPGHTSVEPDDMACTHGDVLYSCRAGVDLGAKRCSRPTGSGWWDSMDAWCCPGGDEP